MLSGEPAVVPGDEHGAAELDAAPRWKHPADSPAAAVTQLRAEGPEISDEDVARLSPLKHKNLNAPGRYSFTATQSAGGTLRPLRDPDASGLDDDEDGVEG